MLHGADVRTVAVDEARTSGALCVGSGVTAATGAGGLLGLGAAPVFALLALWTGLSPRPDMLCMSAHGTSPLDGMALMYGLMAIFHAPPWMKLVASRRAGTRRSRPA